jgi:16S rRNA A1518/A1519 N6-dimethyltransferase RsmA/KsgA/DIM1 with predicted DNA glycosylase/AP lyase activity
MVRASLRSVVDDPIALCERAGIEPTVRAEELSPDDYLRLAGEWVA